MSCRHLPSLTAAAARPKESGEPKPDALVSVVDADLQEEFDASDPQGSIHFTSDDVGNSCRRQRRHNAP